MTTDIHIFSLSLSLSLLHGSPLVRLVFMYAIYLSVSRSSQLIRWLCVLTLSSGATLGLSILLYQFIFLSSRSGGPRNEQRKSIGSGIAALLMLYYPHSFLLFLIFRSAAKILGYMYREFARGRTFSYFSAKAMKHSSIGLCEPASSYFYQNMQNVDTKNSFISPS